MFFFFKQKTAYEMRISDWSSDVCSSDLLLRPRSASGRDFGQMPDRATSLVLRKRFSGRMAPARRGHLPLRSGPRRGRAPRAHGETYASLVKPGIGAPFGAQNA